MSLSRILKGILPRWNTFQHARNILPTSGQCRPTSTLIPSPPPNPSEEAKDNLIYSPREEDKLVLMVDGAVEKVKGGGPAGGAGILFTSYTDSEGMKMRLVHWMFRVNLGTKQPHEAEELAMRKGFEFLEETESWGAVVYSDRQHLVVAVNKGKLVSKYKPLKERSRVKDICWINGVFNISDEQAKEGKTSLDDVTYGIYEPIPDEIKGKAYHESIRRFKRGMGLYLITFEDWISC